jgi:hypothetical protein
VVTGVSRRAGIGTRLPAGWPRWAPACSCTITPRTTVTSRGEAIPADPRP